MVGAIPGASTTVSLTTSCPLMVSCSAGPTFSWLVIARLESGKLPTAYCELMAELFWEVVLDLVA